MVFLKEDSQIRENMEFNAATAQQIARQCYNLHSMATALPGEADSNFKLQCNDGRVFLLKISHAHEAKATIDLQNAVLQHLQTVAKGCAYPQVQANKEGALITYYQSFSGNKHYVRLFSFLSGILFAEVPEQGLQLLQSLGKQLAALTQGLAGFSHPEAKRVLKWDLLQASWISDHLAVLNNEEERHCVTFFLQQFAIVAPLLKTLPQSVIHGDINDYNVLVSPEGRVTGFIDFGDVVASATICELAIAIAYAILNQSDPLQAAAAIVAAYHEEVPLREDELAVLFPLIGMRLCTSVVNSALRKQENPDNAYLTISEKPAWQLVKKWRHIDAAEALARFREACGYNSSDALLAARRKMIGKNVKLSYEEPLHIVRGAGQYLFDAQGRRYLDCVNNVCHVGHCHPKVVAAGQQQMALLNTNTRYLHDYLTRYTEKLLATLPTSLEVCFLVCSGSEANELALRLAYAYTGQHEVVVLQHGYHGNTSSLVNISPYKFNGPGGQGKPAHVHVLPIPNSLGQEQPALPALKQPIAAFIGESLVSCGGQIVMPPAYMQAIYAAVRQAGGVCIADEVQVGLGRVGPDFWGFVTQGVVPDIVTMGKPLGNGHPLACVVTTRAIADAFANGMEYFNSFGGNPVSCSIGLAVLEVLEEEKLPSHALQVGNYLKEKLQRLQGKHTVIADVRGLGLFLGIELIENDTPATALAAAVVNAMKKRGVLLSTDGPWQNVIKIKPPLVFTAENSDFLAANLDEVLTHARP